MFCLMTFKLIYKSKLYKSYDVAKILDLLCHLSDFLTISCPLPIFLPENSLCIYLSARLPVCKSVICLQLSVYLLACLSTSLFCLFACHLCIYLTKYQICPPVCPPVCFLVYLSILLCPLPIAYQTNLLSIYCQLLFTSDLPVCVPKIWLWRSSLVPQKYMRDRSICHFVFNFVLNCSPAYSVFCPSNWLPVY